MSKFVRRVLLVRHGESVWNQESKFTGWTNIPLTANGRREAKQIGLTLASEQLYPNIIFSSVLQRAIDTSSIISNSIIGNFPTIHTSWRLNEKHYGTLEGVPRAHIRDVYGEKFTHMMRKNFNMKPPILRDNPPKYEYPIYRNCYFEKIKNGESKENVLDRLLPYFENDIMYTVSEGQLPLIVTHKHTARVLMKHLLRMSDEDFEYYDIPDKSIIELQFDNASQYTGNRVIPI